MKVRLGFVSNSSSSSFLVNDRGIKTIGECAFVMISLVAQEIKGSESDFSSWKFDSALKWLEENVGYDEPIMFPWSVNFETWIWRNNGGICVDTCNNHPWYEALDYSHEGEDWKYDGRPVGNIDPFSANYFESEYLDLSAMDKVTLETFVPLYLRDRKENC